MRIPKYYIKKPNGKYVIRRKNKHYTTVDTEQEAQYIVKELEKCNWKTTCLKGEGKKIYFKNKITNKNYYERNGRYYIRRKGVYYGSVDNVNLAIKIINKLKKVDWDKNRLPEELINALNFQPKYYYWLDDEQVYAVYIKGEYYGRYKTEKEAKEIVAAIS